jgi:hypothetical protein
MEMRGAVKVMLAESFAFVGLRDSGGGGRTETARRCIASLFVRDQPFLLNEFRRARVIGVVAVVFVDYRVHHDGLFVNC